MTPRAVLVAAMYMMTPGSVLSDVADIGDPLTQWHIHNNLCFTAACRVASLAGADGSGPASLAKVPATPMIHVWIRSPQVWTVRCPEGVGGGEMRPDETVACEHVHGA